MGVIYEKTFKWDRFGFLPYNRETGNTKEFAKFFEGLKE